MGRSTCPSSTVSFPAFSRWPFEPIHGFWQVRREKVESCRGNAGMVTDGIEPMLLLFVARIGATVR